MAHCKWGRISWGSGDVIPLQHFPRYLLWLTTSELSGERLSQGDSSCVMCSVLGNFLMCTVTSGLKHRAVNPASPSTTVPKGPGDISNAKGNPNSTKAPTLSPALSAATAARDGCPWDLSPGSARTWALICHSPVLCTGQSISPCLGGSFPPLPQESPELPKQSHSPSLGREGRDCVCGCPTVSHHPSL